MKPVAICKSQLSKHRVNSASQIPGWEAWLDEHDMPYEYVDCYSYDIIDKLDGYSALLWWYENFAIADLLEAQNILDIAANKGLKVYPDYNTGWHFDDKIAEMYALQAVGAPIPKSWVFYDWTACLDWIDTEAQFPLVAKLRCGSGSNNVKMLKDQKAATKYVKRMFSRGFDPAPSLAYKTFSKVQSTRDWATFKDRLKKVPDFLWTRRFAKQMPVEKGYCYFQEMVPNDGYDIKIAVVGDKLGYFLRHIRKGDFRASGSGDFYYDNPMITEQIIRSAFEAKDALGMQCIGFDYVVDSRTGNGLIIEMCHGFDRDAVYAAGGWFDRDCMWHEGHLNVDHEMLEGLF